jgi:hypothetical protein
MLAQLAGAALAVLFFGWLLRTEWSAAAGKDVAEMAGWPFLSRSRASP